VPLNCPIGLDVNSWHVVERAACRLQRLRHGGKPGCGRAQPITERGELSGQQGVDRGTGIRDQRIPLMCAQFLDLNTAQVQRVGEDLHVHPIGCLEVRRVDGSQVRKATVGPSCLLGQRGVAAVVEAVVEAVLPQRRGRLRVVLKQLGEDVRRKGTGLCRRAVGHERRP